MRRALLLVFALAFAGCSEPTPTCDDPPCVDGGGSPNDRDGDGFEACAPGATTACDCNDSVAAIHPAADETCADGIDQDCDGADAICDEDADGFAADVDCDDTDPAVYPGAPETCDGVDQNCNGRIDELDECRPADLDGDSVAACEPGAPDPSVCDCNDCDPGIFGGAASRERCANAIDDDCDGAVDEGCPAPATDMDGDGRAPPLDCDDNDPFAYPHDAGEPVIDLCGNGVPGSCVPGEDRPCSEDLDGDGYVEPAGCEDDPTVGPLVPEVCNGVDDDCDGIVDEVHDTSAPPTMGCVDGELVTFDTFEHCGACRSACPLEGADQCVSGTCDCSTDASSGACATGSCCASGCVDTDSDPDNCGGCGVRCGMGEACVGGECACGATTASGGQACPDPGTADTNVCCADACADVSSDASNCGSCGLACGPHAICREGFCACEAPSGGQDWRDCNMDRATVGNDGCEIDVMSDGANCGECAISCGDRACVGGSCG